MTTDIFGTSNFTKNEKKIYELATKEICEQLSKERKQKVDSILIRVDIDRKHIHYDRDLSFTLSPKDYFKVDIMSGPYLETIDGDAAEIIYRRYLDLISKYTTQLSKPFVCHSLL